MPAFYSMPTDELVTTCGECQQGLEEDESIFVIQPQDQAISTKLSYQAVTNLPEFFKRYADTSFHCDASTMSSPKYTTADVAAQRGQLRPAVVHVVASLPPADAAWNSKEFAPGRKRGTRSTADLNTKQVARDHASMTLRPHIVQLGLALQLATGQATPLQVSRVEHQANKIIERAREARMERAPEAKTDFARSLRTPSRHDGRPLDFGSGGANLAFSPISTSQSMAGFATSASATVRFRETATPAANFRFSGLDAATGTFSPKQFVSAAGAAAAHAGHAYSMIDTMTAAEEKRGAKAAEASANWALGLKNPTLPSASPLQRPSTAFPGTRRDAYTKMTGVAPSTIASPAATVSRPATSMGIRVPSVPDIIAQHAARKAEQEARRASQQKAAGIAAERVAHVLSLTHKL